MTRDFRLPTKELHLQNTHCAVTFYRWPPAGCPLGKLSFFRHWGENVAIFPGFPQSTCRAPRCSVGVCNLDIDAMKHVLKTSHFINSHFADSILSSDWSTVTILCCPDWSTASARCPKTGPIRARHKNMVKKGFKAY